MLISVLHGQGGQSQKDLDAAAEGSFAALVPRDDQPAPPRAIPGQDQTQVQGQAEDHNDVGEPDAEQKKDWAANIRLLLLCFLVSGLYTISTYFFPILRNLPIFGTVAANTWLWTLNPSFAYIGQGIIMGSETTLHMLLGAVIGWGILSPLAKAKGWAPGDVGDWEHGSKGWIVWVSLSIMLVDAVVSLLYIALRPLIGDKINSWVVKATKRLQKSWAAELFTGRPHDYSPISQREGTDEDDADPSSVVSGTDYEEEEKQADAPEDQRVAPSVVSVGLVLSILLCILTIYLVFGDLVPLYATVLAVFMALILSIMGVRALGETDLNPVSGISKLAQLFFALIIPQTHKSSVLINLVAGAVVCIQRTPILRQKSLFET